MDGKYAFEVSLLLAWVRISILLLGGWREQDVVVPTLEALCCVMDYAKFVLSFVQPKIIKIVVNLIEIMAAAKVMPSII